ncbi:MAG TPA: hypothetical protein VGB15_14225 [Longimicrobium sp.]|jgi:hypothetical protein
MNELPPEGKARVVREAPMSLFGHLSGSVASYGDLVTPTGEAWDADT